MKFNKKAPCAECPFRKDAMAGWLGPDTPEEVLTKVHSEGGYPCHMDMEGKPTNKDGVDCTEVEQCAGAVLSANASCKTYRDPELWAMQLKLREGAPTPILDQFQFLKHHKVPANRKFIGLQIEYEHCGKVLKRRKP